MRNKYRIRKLSGYSNSPERIIEIFNKCLSEYGWISCDDPLKMRIGFVNDYKSEFIFFRYYTIVNRGLIKKWEEWRKVNKHYPLLKAMRK